MKIAILSPFDPYRGGISQFSGMLYTELQLEGHETQAFNFKRLYPDFLFPGKTQYADTEDPNLQIESIRCLDSINPVSYAQSVSRLREFAPDVLIISYWMSFFVPGYAYVANRMRKQCKVIALIHNAIPHEARFFDKPLASFFFKQCDGFIILSKNVEEDLIKLRKDAKFILAPHPLFNHFGGKIDPKEARLRLGISTDKRTLLFFGLIRDYKGLDLLLEAIGRLGDDYQLVVAGECYGNFDKYQQIIERSPAQKRISVFNRYIDDNEIPLFFSASDALVLPYRSATQSGVLAVAYHYDLPVIATPVGNFPQAIEESGTGLITKDISTSSIEEGIKELFEKGQISSFATAIQELKKNLSWEVFTRKILHFASQL